MELLSASYRGTVKIQDNICHLNILSFHCKWFDDDDDYDDD